jgi:solute carrier family 40 (iron-regulated transporter), member 1
MRRIDLLCKIFGPLCIALLDGASTEVAIIVNFGMNLTSVLVEYYAIALVYRDVPELKESKRTSITERIDLEPSLEAGTRPTHNWRHVKTILMKSAADFNLYYRHRVFLPSIAGSLLYLTVLNFAGQMVTYLLAAGYSSTQIGIARTLSVAFEVLATWVAPWLMGEIGPVRAGLWLSSWQVTMLVAGNVVFWTFIDTPILSASGLVGGTILSRVGLRGFDLCTQIIVQEARRPQDVKFRTNSIYRTWKLKIAGLSPRLKRRGRMRLNSCPMLQPSSFPVLTSSSGQP